MIFCEPTNADGSPVIEWIRDVFGECLYNDKEAIGMFIGLSSIACWFCAQVPQLVVNFRNGKAESLSWLFLLIWFLGDSSNLIGCILTRQLPFQTYLAIYFVIMDAFLLLQWIYYGYGKDCIFKWFPSRPRSRNEEEKRLLSSLIDEDQVSIHAEDGEDSESAANATGSAANLLRPPVKVTLYAMIWPVVIAMMLTPWISDSLAPIMPDSFELSMPSRAKESHMRSLFAFTPMQSYGIGVFGLPDVHHAPGAPFREKNESDQDAERRRREFIAGEFFAWISVTCYLTSRLPQIWKNYQRGSVAGLSIWLFLFAVLGNTCYCLSIFLKSTERDFLLKALPYLLGSGGTLLFDATIFVQYMHYTRGKARAMPLE